MVGIHTGYVPSVDRNDRSLLVYLLEHDAWLTHERYNQQRGFCRKLEQNLKNLLILIHLHYIAR